MRDIDEERMDLLREAILMGLADAAFMRFVPGSIHYQRRTRDEVPGGAFFYGMGEEVGAERGKPEPRQQAHFGGRRAGKTFQERDFGRWQAKTLPPGVLDRARGLKRMIASTDYPGERDNAQAALDRLMAKHGFTERDL